MKHVLMGVYQVYSNKCPGVKIGPAPGVIDFPYMCIAKTSKIKVCSNKSPGVQTGPTPGASLQVSYLRAMMALLF
jgi:hypothetical protein